MNRRSFLKALVAGSAAAVIGAAPKRLTTDAWAFTWGEGVVVPMRMSYTPLPKHPGGHNDLLDSMRYLMHAIRDDPGLFFSGEIS